MTRQRFIVGLIFTAVVLTLTPGVTASASRPPVFGMPKNAAISTQSGTPVTKTIKFTNNGRKRTRPLNVSFAAGAPGLTLASSRCDGKRVRPGRTCSSLVAFDVDVATIITGTLTIGTRRRHASTNITATAAPGPNTNLVVSPASTNVGDVQTATKTFTFTNNTPDAMAGPLTPVIDPAGDFAINGGTCVQAITLAVGDSCSVIVKYTRSDNAAASATVSLEHNSVTVSDAATISSDVHVEAPKLSVSPSSRNVGDVYTATGLVFTFTNSTGATIEGTFTAVLDPIGNDFAITGGDCTTVASLNDGDTCTVEVSYNRDIYTGTQVSLSLYAGDTLVSDSATLIAARGD